MTNLKFSDGNEELKKAQGDFIRFQFERYDSWLTSEADKALHYLFLTNSGGAVAVLSFLGTVPELRQKWELLFALSCFAFGVILVGVVRAFEFERSSRSRKEWVIDASKFYSDAIAWTELLQENDRRDNNSISRFFAYLCFFLFILGMVVGGSGLVWPKIVVMFQFVASLF